MFQDKTQSRDQLGMIWKSCDFHSNLRMNPVSVSTDHYCSIRNALSRKTAPRLKNSDHALMNMLTLLLRSIFSTFKLFFQASTPSLPLHQQFEQCFLFQDSICTVLQSFRTSPPKIYAVMTYRSNMVIYSASCSTWLRTRVSVQFFALLTSRIPENAVFKTLNYATISENLMFSQ